MYKNKSISGRNNICGIKIRELRSRMNDVSQKKFHLTGALVIWISNRLIARCRKNNRNLYITCVQATTWILPL